MCILGYRKMEQYSHFCSPDFTGDYTFNECRLRSCFLPRTTDCSVDQPKDSDDEHDPSRGGSDWDGKEVS